VQVQPGSFFPTPWGFTVPVVMLMSCVGKPHGHGMIRFTSASPKSRPLIDSRLLLDDRDRAVAAEALRLALMCADTSVMKGLGRLLWPTRAVMEDPARLDQFLFRISDSGYHPCGTVPMGADGDPRGAVTQRGRVRQVEGLWVADASVMPTIPSSNTNFPTLMMGERFGEWFRDGVD
jgi:choline dehydrogenase